MHFDHVFILDFSARSAPSPVKPTADALWLGHAAAGTRRATATYHRTRVGVFAEMERRLVDLTQRGETTLLGVDFALGYPAGFADAAGLPGDEAPWRRTWRYLAEAIEDGPDQRNNRFAVAAALNQRIKPAGPGPFWGCPPAAASDDLTPRRAGVDSLLPRRRLVEQRLASAQEVWKLYTTGAVGSQTLLGLPHLHRLRFASPLRDRLRVWPFEPPGFGRGVEGSVWVAEVYPSLVNDAADRLLERRRTVTVRDQAQVVALAEHFVARQRRGDLADAFAPPAGLTARQLRQCTDEEGWVLGG